MPKEIDNNVEAKQSGRNYFDVLTLRAGDAIFALQNDKSLEVKSLNYLIESSLKRLKELKDLYDNRVSSDSSQQYLIEAIHENQISRAEINGWIDSVEKAIYPALKRRLQYYATLTESNEDCLLMTDIEDQVVVSHQSPLNETELYSCGKILALLSDSEEKEELLQQFHALCPKKQQVAEAKEENSQSELSVHSDSIFSSDSELDELTESDSDNEEAQSELYPLKFTLKKSYKTLPTDNKNDIEIPNEVASNNQISVPYVNRNTPAISVAIQPPIRPDITTGQKIVLTTAMSVSLGTLGGMIGLLLASTLGPFVLAIGGVLGLSMGLAWGVKKFCAPISAKQTLTNVNDEPINVANQASTTQIFQQPGFKNTAEKKSSHDAKKLPPPIKPTYRRLDKGQLPKPLSTELVRRKSF